MKEVTVFIDEAGSMRVKVDGVTKPEALMMLNLACKALDKKIVDETRIITPNVQNVVRMS